MYGMRKVTFVSRRNASQSEQTSVILSYDTPRTSLFEAPYEQPHIATLFSATCWHWIAGAVAAGGWLGAAGAQTPDAKIFGAAGVETSERPKGPWKPVSDRKSASALSASAYANSGGRSVFKTIPTSLSLVSAI